MSSLAQQGISTVESPHYNSFSMGTSTINNLLAGTDGNGAAMGLNSLSLNGSGHSMMQQPTLPQALLDSSNQGSTSGNTVSTYYDSTTQQCVVADVIMVRELQVSSVHTQYAKVPPGTLCQRLLCVLS